MSSANGADADTSSHDDRLDRAFDRVARLGIDIEGDEGLTDREAAAVRAFTALAGEGILTGEVPVTPAGPSDPPPEPPPAPAAPDEGPRHDPPADGPLRPDAVLRGRRLTGHDRGGESGAGGPEIEIPVAPPDPPAAPAGGSTAAGPFPPPASAATEARPVTGAYGAVPVLGSPAGRADAARRSATGAASAPTATAPARTSRPDARPVAPVAATSATGDADPDGVRPRAVDRYLLDLLALTIATGAFVTPWVWMFVVAVGAVVGMSLRSLSTHGTDPGDLGRRVVRRVLAWLRPRSLVWGVIVTARTIMLAVLLPTVACALWWTLTEGVNGAVVAGRMGAWTHGFRVGAACICFMLVAGVGEAHERRAAIVSRVAARAGRGQVVAIAASALLVAAGVVALVPRAGGGRLAGDDGLGWMPYRVRDNVDRLRDDLVAAEVHAAGGCLSDHHGLTWQARYSTGNPVGAPDVARLVARDGAPSAAQVATAAATLHNQLAPWVERIEISAGDVDLVVLDRADLPSGQPVVTVDRLIAGATSGGGFLADAAGDGPGVAGGVDRGVALRCSGTPIP